jgi:hypothetical protein
VGGLRVADFEAKEMLAMTNAVRGSFVPSGFFQSSISFIALVSHIPFLVQLSDDRTLRYHIHFRGSVLGSANAPRPLRIDHFTGAI